MEQKYEDLKFLSRQYQQRISFVSTLKVQLINMLDQTMPGITKILALKSRDPEKCALLLFIKRYKSFDEIQRIGKTRFLSTYATLMKKTPDRYAPKKGLEIYELARDSITPAEKILTFGRPRISASVCWQPLRMQRMKSLRRCRTLRKPSLNTRCFAQ